MKYPHLQKLAQHIYITGPPGAGKTTEANKLKKQLNMPVVHIDNVVNVDKHPDWQAYINELTTPHIIEGHQFLETPVKGDVRIIDEPSAVLIKRLLRRGWTDEEGQVRGGKKDKEEAEHLVAYFKNKLREAYPDLQKLAENYRFTGDVQGVGLRAATHALLDEHNLPGVAYNDPHTEEVLLTIGGKRFKRDTVISAIKKYLDEANRDYTLEPVDKKEKLKPVSISPEELSAAYNRHGFTTIGAKDLDERIGYATKRFRVKEQDGNLVGKLPPLAYAQLLGYSPVYKHQIKTPEEFGPQYWREPEKFN